MPDTHPTASLMMRPVKPGDEQPIAQLVRTRSAWMRKLGLPDWEAAAEDLAAHAADPDTPAWVLTTGGEIIGCTTLYDQAPPWLWTEKERSEPVLFMATTVTHPRYAGRQLGCQVAWWVLDHAARTGRTWVGRGTFVPRLVRYYREEQGWQVIREKERDGRTITGLARKAARMPDLEIRTSL